MEGWAVEGVKETMCKGMLNSWVSSGVICLGGSSTVTPRLLWGPSASPLPQSMPGAWQEAR